MALELSVVADLLSQQTNIKQQIILEIDGIPLVFGAVEVTKLALYGDDIKYGDEGLVYGGVIEEPNGRAYISLKGTTNNIRQQLEVDKGGVGSVMKFNVVLIDKNQEITNAFTPGVFVDDILSREANIYINFVGGAHPEDSIRIFNGIVTGQEASPGSWRVAISHPEFLKRQDLYQQINTKLDGGISDSATSLVLDTVGSLITPADAVRSFIRVNDELIEYTTITPATRTLSGLLRGAQGTTAASHLDDDDAISFYLLTGTTVDLALKTMLSNPGNVPFEEGVKVPRFESISATLNVPNGFFVADRTLQDNLGLVAGDLVTSTGATEGVNNFSERAIIGFIKTGAGTVVIVDGADLIVEIESAAVVSFRSQYNTLPVGSACGMKPSQVDVAQHVKLNTFFGATLPTEEFKIKNTISAKSWLSEQIYFPTGFYQVPRKGRASTNITLPPLVLDTLVELTDKNTKRVDQNKIKRQITKNFYNNIVYKFNRDVLTDKFLAGEVFFSQRSVNRIDTGVKSLTLESDGLLDNPVTRTFLDSQARRFQDRYQFAAESISVQCNYKTGFRIEIADIVLYGTPNLQIPDINTGDRDFQPRLMEVINKEMNLKNGDVRLELLDSGFGLDGRFGVISPNSYIDAGSTATNILLKPSFGTNTFGIERLKWENFIGEEIEIRNQDFTFRETVTLVEFDPDTLAGIVVDPALSVPPPEDYIIDLPDYPLGTDEKENAKMKAIHCFADPAVNITAGVSTTIFEVAVGDIGKFEIDAFVRVHSLSFSDDSSADSTGDDLQVTVVDTGLNRVTVSASMGFTPSVGDIVDLVGFNDLGLPYRQI